MTNPSETRRRAPANASPWRNSYKNMPRLSWEQRNCPAGIADVAKCFNSDLFGSLGGGLKKLGTSTTNFACSSDE